jgi:transposase
VQPVVISSVRAQLEELIQTLNTQVEQMDKELAQLIKYELPVEGGDIGDEGVEGEEATESSRGIEATENIKAKEAMEVTDVLEEAAWKKSIALSRTIPGIGPLTASWLVLSTLNFTTFHSCHSPQALVHYAGLAPIERTSGTSIRGRPQIGHSGHGGKCSITNITIHGDPDSGQV